MCVCVCETWGEFRSGNHKNVVLKKRDVFVFCLTLLSFRYHDKRNEVKRREVRECDG